MRRRLTRGVRCAGCAVGGPSSWHALDVATAGSRKGRRSSSSARFAGSTALAIALTLALAPAPAHAQQRQPPTIHAVTTIGSSTNDLVSRRVRLSGGLVAEIEYLTIEMRLPFWTLLGEPLLNPVARWRWEEGARIHILDGPNGARLVTFQLDPNADGIELHDGGQTVSMPREIFERRARLIGFHYMLAFPDLAGAGSRPTPEVLMRSYDGVVDDRPNEWGWNVAGSPNWAELVARAGDGVPVPGRAPERGYLPADEARRVFQLQMRQCGQDAARRPLPMPSGRCEANGYERFLPYGVDISVMSLFWEAQRAHPALRDRLWPRPRDRQVIALAGALAGRVDEETPRRAALLRRTLDAFRGDLGDRAVALAEAELERVDEAGVVALAAELRATADAVLAQAEAGLVEDATYDRLVALRERAEALSGATARRIATQARGLERLGARVAWVQLEYEGTTDDHLTLRVARRDGNDGTVIERGPHMSLVPPRPALFYSNGGRESDTVDVEWSVLDHDNRGAPNRMRATVSVPFEEGEVALLTIRPYGFDGLARYTWGPCSVTLYGLRDGAVQLGGRGGRVLMPVNYESRPIGAPATLAVDGPSECVLHYGTGAIWFDPFAGRGR